MLLAANICGAEVITTVESDWTTYRVDITLDKNFEMYGGGVAGDLFHFYFDFNRAYLPYQSNQYDLNTEGGFQPYAQYGILNNLTDDPTDRVVFTEGFTRGDTAWDFNGTYLSGWTPFSVRFTDGEISSVDTILGILGIASGNFFYHTSTEFVTGHVTGIVDLGKVTEVPEPETLALLGLGLLGFGCRAFRRDAA